MSDIIGRQLKSVAVGQRLNQRASCLEAQPWLTEHGKQSVTALEILHGVMLNPKMAKHALFYFRDPSYAISRAGFTEEDPARRDLLAALKDAIRKSGFPV